MEYLILLNLVLIALVCWFAFQAGKDKALIMFQVEDLKRTVFDLHVELIKLKNKKPV
jgi:hypothetical protein